MPAPHVSPTPSPSRACARCPSSSGCTACTRPGRAGRRPSSSSSWRCPTCSTAGSPAATDWQSDLGRCARPGHRPHSSSSSWSALLLLSARCPGGPSCRSSCATASCWPARPYALHYHEKPQHHEGRQLGNFMLVCGIEFFIIDARASAGPSTPSAPRCTWSPAFATSGASSCAGSARGRDVGGAARPASLAATPARPVPRRRLLVLSGHADASRQPRPFELDGRPMRAVVMAGGEGTRLRPLTSNQPKPMVPVANKPCMEHIIELLKRHGIEDIVVTAGVPAQGHPRLLRRRQRARREHQLLGRAGARWAPPAASRTPRSCSASASS